MIKTKPGRLQIISVIIFLVPLWYVHFARLSPELTQPFFLNNVMLLCMVAVIVSLKPAGNAPALTRSKFSVDADRQVSSIQQMLKKALKCEAEESMVSHCE